MECGGSLITIISALLCCDEQTWLFNLCDLIQHEDVAIFVLKSIKKKSQNGESKALRQVEVLLTVEFLGTVQCPRSCFWWRINNLCKAGMRGLAHVKTVYISNVSLRSLQLHQTSKKSNEK